MMRNEVGCCRWPMAIVVLTTGVLILGLGLYAEETSSVTSEKAAVSPGASQKATAGNQEKSGSRECGVCEPGATEEGEPDCYDGYDDDFNSGCNWEGEPPFPFSAISCGETVCGTSGTHLDSGGFEVRDTDWYRLELTAEEYVTFTIEADFPAQILIIDAGDESCEEGSYTTLGSKTGEQCEVLTLLRCLQAGVYYLWAGPASGEEVECPTIYNIWISCEDCPAIGACCYPDGSCGIMGEQDCIDDGGEYLGNATTCDPNCCLQPDVTGGDNCGDVTILPVPTDGTPVIISGDSTPATGPDTEACGTMAEDILWWEAFSIDQCADVYIDFCCSPLTLSPMWISLSVGCPCESTAHVTDHNFSSGTLEMDCDPLISQLIAFWEDLPAGTYYYAILADPERSEYIGPYQMHISATAYSGACCLDSDCQVLCEVSECLAAGGNYLGDDVACADQCLTGACCDQATGLCLDEGGVPQDQAWCEDHGEGFRYVGGSDCAEDPCAPPNDLCENAVEIVIDPETHEGEATSDDTNATVSDSDPSLSCYYGPGCSSDPEDLCDPTDGGPLGTYCKGVGTLWWKFTATLADVDIDTCLSSGETDTVMAIYGPIEPETDCHDLTTEDEHNWGIDYCGCSEDADPYCEYDEETNYNSRIEARGLTVGAEYYIMTTAFEETCRGSLTVLIAPPPIAVGACCNDETTVCEENVEEPACAYRFGGDESVCRSLNPACGNGACCEADGNCLPNLEEYICEAGGGVAFFPGRTCLPNPCLLGACCDDATGVCEEDFQAGYCEEHRRFAADATCGDFDPECGGCEDAVINVVIVTDDYGDETTWEVTDHYSSEVIAQGGPYESRTYYNIPVCVSSGRDGCYDFTIYDSYGDGICCGQGKGWYEVYFDGELVGSGGEFGSQETIAEIGGGCGVFGVPTAHRSYHLQGAYDGYLDLTVDNIEPRACGIQTLEVDFSEDLTGATVGASVECWDDPYAGSVTVDSPVGNMVVVHFDPQLPDQTCCRITFDTDASGTVDVRTLIGDLDRNNQVTSGDMDSVANQIGQALTGSNFTKDQDCNGSITSGDMDSIANKIGRTAADCP